MPLNSAPLPQERGDREDYAGAPAGASVSQLSDSRRRIPVSACIITFNEEARIADCIRRLSFCAEVVVVDCHSSDRTREISRRLGARVIERDWPGYRTQKEFAVRAARHLWVLCVDADELITPRLRQQILAHQAQGFEGYAGFSAPRRTEYFGRFLRFGNAYPDRAIRLFDKRLGGWCGREIHEHTRVTGRIGRLSACVEHRPYRDLSAQIERWQSYARLMATAMNASGVRSSTSRIWLNPFWRFLRGYFLRLGFLDGWRGLVFAFLEADYVRQKYMNLYVLQRGFAVQRDRNA